MADEKNQQLTNLTAEVAEQTGTQRKLLSDISAELSEQTRQDADFQKHNLRVLKSIATLMHKSLHLEEMQAKEVKRSAEKATKGGKKDGKPEQKDDLELKDPGLNLGEWATAIAGALAGLAAGLASGLASMANNLMLKPMVRAFKKMTLKVLGPSQYRKLVKSIDGFFKAIPEFFKSIGKFAKDTGAKTLTKIKGAFKPLTDLPGKITKALSEAKIFKGRTFRTLSKTLSSFGQGISKSFSGIVKSGKAIAKFAEGMAKPFSGIAQEFGPITKIFKRLPSLFKSFFKVFKVFGKAIAPIIVGIKTIMGAFKILTDKNTSMMDKAIDMLLLLPKVIGEFFFEIPDMIKDGLSWVFKKIFGDDNPVSKFFDSFSFSKLWTDAVDAVAGFFKNLPENMKKIGDAIGDAVSGAVDWAYEKALGFGKFVMDKVKGMWNSIKKTFKNIGKKVGSVVYDGVQWIKDKVIGIKDDLLRTIENFMGDPVGTMTKIITAPATLIKKAVAWVLSKIGFDDISTKLKEMDFGLILKNIILAPGRLIRKAVSFVLEKLGFGKDGKGEGDISDIEDQSTTQKILKLATDIIFAPWKLVQLAWKKIADIISFDKLKENLTGLKASSITDGIKNFAKNFLRAAVEKFPMLKHIPGVKGLIGETESSAADLQEVSVDATRKSDGELADTLLQEIETPKREKKYVPMLGSSVDAANQWLIDNGYLDADDPRVKPAAETGAISGLGQESVAQADEMRLENERLQNSRAESAAPAGAPGNTVIADNSTNSVTNVNQTISSPQPSTLDHTDPYAAMTR